MLNERKRLEAAIVGRTITGIEWQEGKTQWYGTLNENNTFIDYILLDDGSRVGFLSGNKIDEIEVEMYHQSKTEPE